MQRVSEEIIFQGICMTRVIWATLAFPLALLGYADFAAGQTLSKTGQVTSAGSDFGSTTQAQNGDTISYVIQYSNPGGAAAMLDIKDPIPAGTAYLAGSLQVPTQLSKQWSTDGGATWLTTEPGSGITNVREQTLNPTLFAGASGYLSNLAAPPATSLATAGSSGDGYRAIPLNNNVYVINHHNGGTYLDCFSETTGTRCTNYPVHPSASAGTAFSTSAYSTSDPNWTGTPGKPLEYVDRVNNKIYYPASDFNGHAGIMCVDVTNRVSCGFTGLYTASNLGVGGGTGNFPGYNGIQSSTSGKLYLILNNSGTLYCYDAVAGNPCGGSPFVVPATTDAYSELSLRLGTKIIVSSPNSPAQVFCWDQAANALCSGWSTQTLAGNSYVQLYPVLNAIGTPTGACLRGNQNAAKACFNLDGTSYTPPASFLTWMDNYVDGFYNSSSYSFGDATYYSTRTFANGQPGGAGPWKEGCYDWSVPGDCAGNAGEVWPVTGSNVTQFHYSTIADPTLPGCMWMDGDDGIIGSFWALDGGNCAGHTSLNATITPTNLTCDGLAHTIAWTNVNLFGLTNANYTSARITIRDASTNLVIPGFNNVAIASFPFDISSISYATDPSIIVSVQFAGVSSAAPWSANPPPYMTVNWNGPGPQMCFSVTPSGCTMASLTNSVTATTTVPGNSPSTISANANSFTHILDASCANPGTITLTKEVCTDPSPANCTATSTNWVPSTSLLSGSTASWRVKVTNTSATDEARNVTLTDAVAPSCVSAAGSFTLAAGATATFVCSSANVATPTTNTAAATGTLVVTGVPNGTPGPSVASNPGSATATVTSSVPLTVAKSFTPSTINSGSASLLTITLTNPNAGVITGAAFVDSYAANVFNTVSPSGITTCAGGTVTAVANGGSVSLSGGTVAASGSCTVTVNVTSILAGSYLNSTGITTTTNAGSTGPATATLTVNNIAPLAVKTFVPSTVYANAPSVLTITLTNPNPGPVTGVAFTDNYPPNLTNTSAPSGGTSCGGAVGAAANGNSITLTNGTIPANGSCTVTVNVQSTLAGSYVNSTGTITSSNAPSFGPANGTLTVLAPPTVTKTFTPSLMLANASSVLTIALTNSSGVAISGVSFTDTYPASLVNTASPAGATSCGGSMTALANAGSVTLAGGTIPPNASCTVTINVTSAVGGTYVNNTGIITTGTGVIPGAQGTLQVIAPPSVAKSFTPASISIGGNSLLTISLNNPNSTTAITGAAFTDNYPANLLNSATPAVTSTCGGSVTAVANGSSLALAGGTIPAAGSCTVTVNVTSNAMGVYNNRTGILTTTNAGTAGPANATLTVTNTPFTASKTFSATTINTGAVSLLTITLANPNVAPVNGVAFSDNYPSNLLNTATPNAASTCGGTVTAAANGSSLTLVGGTTPANGSCAVTVNVTSTMPGIYLNTTGTVTSTNAGSAGAAAATLTVNIVPFTVGKSFAPDTIASGSPSVLTILLTNPNPQVVNGVAFTDTYPSGMVNTSNAAATSSCGGTLTGANNGNSVALTGGAIPASGSCTVSVNVTGVSMGTYLNTTGTVTSTNGGNSGPATATLIVPGIMQQVPALSKWALIVLAGLLAIAGGGWAPARRRM